MATLSKTSSGRRFVQFPAVIGRGKRTISLGAIDEATARTICGHVSDLVKSAVALSPVPRATAKWLTTIGDALHRKLVKVGLVKSRESQSHATLAPFLDGYIAGRTDLKPGTRTVLKQVRRALVLFFGETIPLTSLNRGVMGDWQRWVKSKYSTATVAAFTKKAKQMLQDAVHRELLTENPMRGLKAGSMANKERQRYITAGTIYEVLSACKDVEWQLIFMLARFAGLRIPSEIRGLRWSDVDFVRRRMLVRSPKTEHHKGRESREVPIVPELMPFLRAAFDPENVRVIMLHRGENLGTQAQRIIKRAGLTPWPKTFQNLRSSCETDFTAKHELHVVCAWMGNTEAVAMKHYLQVTDAHFEKASAAPAQRVEAEPAKNPPTNVNISGFFGGIAPTGLGQDTKKTFKFLNAVKRAQRRALHGLQLAHATMRVEDIAHLEREVAMAKGGGR